MIVVDASVAVKWFFPETGSPAAQALLRGSAPLNAPALARVEVYAAITRKVRLREIERDEARAACELWAAAIENGVLSLTPDEEVIPEAIDLAIKLAHPLQDCLYLALAQRRQAVLIIADQRFYARAASVYASVELLTGIP